MDLVKECEELIDGYCDGSISLCQLSQMCDGLQQLVQYNEFYRSQAFRDLLDTVDSPKGALLAGCCRKILMRLSLGANLNPKIQVKDQLIQLSSIMHYANLPRQLGIMIASQIVISDADACLLLEELVNNELLYQAFPTVLVDTVAHSLIELPLPFTSMSGQALKLLYDMYKVREESFDDACFEAIHSENPDLCNLGVLERLEAVYRYGLRIEELIGERMDTAGQEKPVGEVMKISGKILHAYLRRFVKEKIIFDFSEIKNLRTDFLVELVSSEIFSEMIELVRLKFVFESLTDSQACLVNHGCSQMSSRTTPCISDALLLRNTHLIMDDKFGEFRAFASAMLFRKTVPNFKMHAILNQGRWTPVTDLEKHAKFFFTQELSICLVEDRVVKKTAWLTAEEYFLLKGGSSECIGKLVNKTLSIKDRSDMHKRSTQALTWFTTGSTQAEAVERLRAAFFDRVNGGSDDQLAPGASDKQKKLIREWTIRNRIRCVIKEKRLVTPDELLTEVNTILHPTDHIDLAYLYKITDSSFFSGVIAKRTRAEQLMNIAALTGLKAPIVDDGESTFYYTLVYTRVCVTGNLNDER